MDYLKEEIDVQNAIGGKFTTTMFKVVNDTSKSVWPSNINDMTMVLEYVINQLCTRHSDNKSQWQEIWFMFKAIKSLACKEHEVPRTLVGHYFSVLTIFQNLSEEINSREAGILHAAFGELIEAYLKSIVRANHTNFINKL